MLICNNAPNFTASAVMPDNSIDESFDLHSYINGSYAVIFFYPLDFTFVCPSEILEFNAKFAEFESRNCKVIGISVDSHFTHLAWRNTDIKNGGIGQVKFPLVADLTKSIAKNYDVLLNEAVSLRGTFLIDKSKTIRHCVINDLPLGRNIDEAIRMVDALTFHAMHGDVCPANWNKNETAMKATQEGVKEYLSKKY